MIDLSGQTTVKIDWSLDTETNLVTLVLKEEDDVTELGTMVLDAARFKSMIEALGEVGANFLKGITSIQGHHTLFTNETNKSTTEFNP